MKKKLNQFVFFLSADSQPIPEEVAVFFREKDAERAGAVENEYNHQAFLAGMVKVSSATPRRRKFWSRNADTGILRLALQP